MVEGHVVALLSLGHPYRLYELKYGRPADHEDEEADEPGSDGVLGLVLL